MSERYQISQLVNSLKDYQYQSIPGDYPDAGVLIPFHYPENQEAEILLTVRADHLNSHAGEIAFPGGKVEDDDVDIIATALRESHEEINLQPDSVQVVCQMDQMMSKAGIRVSPVVGVLDSVDGLVANPEELDSIFSVPVRYFVETQPEIRRFHFDGASWEMPEYHYQGHRIWGLTSMIIVNLINIVYKMGLPEFRRPDFIKFEK